MDNRVFSWYIGAVVGKTQRFLTKKLRWTGTWVVSHRNTRGQAIVPSSCSKQEDKMLEGPFDAVKVGCTVSPVRE